MRWTKEEIQLTTKLIKEGLAYSNISQITGRDSNAIRVKAGKLKILVTEYRIKEIAGEKFCSHACSATYNNKLRGFKSREYKKVDCIICSNPCHKYNKCCSKKCVEQLNINKLESKIKSGDNISIKTIRKYLLEKRGAKCSECGWDKIHKVTGLVPLHLDHVDGNSENNRLDNLKILCPNCHSLTPTYGILNKGSGRRLRRIKREQGLID